MEEKLKELINEQKKTNEILSYSNQGKNPYELLTMAKIKEEYGIGGGKLLKMFNDPDLPVQRYTSPYKVQRKELDKYLSVSHDYLCD